MPFSGTTYCDKCGDSSSTGNPCHRCKISTLAAQLAEAKADVWEGEALIFKRDAEREIDQLRKELEEAKDEVSCLSDLWKSDVDAYTELEAEVERLESALEMLEGNYDTALRWNMELEEQLASAQAKAEVERRVLEKLWGAARRHITELEAEVEWGARG
jgi:chromosome segregation ATPase